MKSYIHAQKNKQGENTSQEEKPDPEASKKPPSTLEIVGYEFLTGKLHEAWHGNQSKQEKQQKERTDRTATKTTTEQDAIQTEAEKRLAEMKAIRAKRAAKQQAQTKRQDRER